MKKHLTPFLASIRNNGFAFGLFLLLWAICSVFVPAYMIPAPWKVLQQSARSVPPDFWRHFGLTCYRTLAGFLCAFGGGTFCGVVAFEFRAIPYFNTLFALFEVIPGIILGVIFLLLFGVGSSVPIALVAFLTFPAIAINTAHGLAKKSGLLEQYVRSIGGRKEHILKYIYLPVLIPTFQSNLTIGFSLSLKVVVLGEFIGSQDGIGYLLNLSGIYFKMDAVFFYLTVILLLMMSFQVAQQILFSVFWGKYFYPE